VYVVSALVFSECEWIFFEYGGVPSVLRGMGSVGSRFVLAFL
jgi:hypothetical protein